MLYIFHHGIVLCNEFVHANIMDKTEIQASAQVKWQCLPIDYVKLNTDGALERGKGKVGLWFVVRNSLGNCLAIVSIPFLINWSPLSAELIAIFHGLSFCKEENMLH